MSATPFTVTQVNAIVARQIALAPDLEDLLVEGEVSNVSRPASGHIYFTIKDARAQLRCVCFRSNLAFVPFRPENGMTVIVHGRIEVYEQSGAYQLYVDRIDPSGIGALAVAIEQRRKTLFAEGLLDPARRRPLPRLPRRVVVITSLSGAAFRDVCTVIRRRAPGVDIVAIPAVVQGDDAAHSIVRALSLVDRVKGADVVLIVRGGGSIEDLMAFNDLDVARAVAACVLPIVSGVGHETDTTLVDSVADQRAATPSAAAEVAVPDRNDLLRGVDERGHRLRGALRSRVASRRAGLGRLHHRLDVASPQRRVAALREALAQRTARVNAAVQAGVAQRRRRLENTTHRLIGGSPAQRVRVERQHLLRRSDHLNAAVLAVVDSRRVAVTQRRSRLDLLSPLHRIDRARSDVVHRRAALVSALFRRIADAQTRMSSTAQRLTTATPQRRVDQLRLDVASRRRHLEALSPDAVLQRGYSITTDATTGAVVTASDAVAPGNALRIRLARGTIAATAVGEAGETQQTRTDVRSRGGDDAADD